MLSNANPFVVREDENSLNKSSKMSVALFCHWIGLASSGLTEREIRFALGLILSESCRYAISQANTLNELEQLAGIQVHIFTCSLQNH